MANLVETAKSAGSFRTLLKAVETAGLANTLAGPGPFTVFAPTDEAFAKLPAGTVENLLKDKQKLTSVLTYHVVPGRMKATDVALMPTLKTVQGQTLPVNATAGVNVAGAKVIKADVMADNGVIHVIDRVMLPQ